MVGDEKINLSQLPDHAVVQLMGATQPVLVEVVNTPASITQGLSGRAQLGGSNPQVEGMLFVLPRPQQAAFWMKEMKFDLDLVWIKDNQVVEVTPQVPAPEMSVGELGLPIYQPQQVVDLVLEVNAGQAQAWNLIPGTNLTFLPE